MPDTDIQALDLAAIEGVHRAPPVTDGLGRTWINCEFCEVPAPCDAVALLAEVRRLQIALQNAVEENFCIGCPEW